MRDNEPYIEEARKHGNERCVACGCLIKISFGCSHCRNSKESYREVKDYLATKGVKLS